VPDSPRNSSSSRQQILPPQIIRRLNESKQITSISCTLEHSLACSEITGRVYSWGSGENGRLGHGDDAVNKSERIPKEVVAFSSDKILKHGRTERLKKKLRQANADQLKHQRRRALE